MLLSEILRIKGNTLYTTTPEGAVLDAVKAMADLAIEMAHNPKPQRSEQRWARFVE